MKKSVKLVSVVLTAAIVAGCLSMPGFAAFSDVTEEKSDYAVLEELASRGVVKGYTDGSFKPQNSVTRAELAAMIVRAIGKDGEVSDSIENPPFPDVDTPDSAWAIGYIRTANELGIIDGYPDGEFKPENEALYEDTVKMIVCAMGYGDVGSKFSTWDQKYFKMAEALGITDGVSCEVGTAVTRSVVARLLYNCIKSGLVEKIDSVSETIVKNVPEYYRLIGYEDRGYINSSLASTDLYPDYIKQEVEESIEEIKAVQGEDTVTFAFMTDIHHGLTTFNKVRETRTMNAYREIAKNVKIDKLVLGGDHVNDGPKEYMSDCLVELKDILGEIEYYPINGNHDDASHWDKFYIKNEGKYVNHLEVSERYDLFYSHLPKLGAKFDDKNPALYYYCDDAENKIRYIMLDSNYVDYVHNEDGTLKHWGMQNYVFIQKQLDWLCNEALKFDEEGWGVVLFAHGLYMPDGTSKKHFDGTAMLNKILTAYTEKTALKDTWGEDDLKQDVDIDFSDKIVADIIGVFTGDAHKDYACYNGKIPYFITGMAGVYSKHKARVDGTASELMFDVITIDRANRTVYLSRVGSGESRKAEY